MELERTSRTRAVTIRREEPGQREEPAWWEVYCSGCDYLGSVNVLRAITATWTEALAKADRHLLTHHAHEINRSPTRSPRSITNSSPWAPRRRRPPARDATTR